jgi:hypothetical protein
MVSIHCSDNFYTLKGSRILSGTFVNETSCYCPGGCAGNIPYISSYKGCHIFLYGCLRSSTTTITKDAIPIIIDTTLTLIVTMWQGTWVYSFNSTMWAICQKSTVTYKCQYFTIMSHICYCDQKWETHHALLEIGTDGSAQTRRNLLV